MDGTSTNNLVRGATFFQHAGISIVFVFIPIIANGVTGSIFETGLVVASFSLAQILSELYFGRRSDRRGTRLLFIRAGFVACAATFGLHYFADGLAELLLARVAAGVASGIMIPAMIAYAYEANAERRAAAAVLSFHALGWLAGIAAAGLANDLRLIFLISSASFAAGLAFTRGLPDTGQQRELGRGTVRGIISRNRHLFLALLLRHVGASAVWTILPIMIMERLGGQLYHVSIVYVANTLTAFVMMNLMASRINVPNETKFKAGIGCTAFVFVGLSVVTEWWMAMPFMALVGATWAFLFIGGSFYLMENNPRSTSTGIFSSTISIATVAGPVIGGSIAFAYGYAAVMYFAIAVIAAAFAVSLRVRPSPAPSGSSPWPQGA